MIHLIILVLLLTIFYWILVILRLLMDEYECSNETKSDFLKDLIPFRLIYRSIVKAYKELR